MTLDIYLTAIENASLNTYKKPSPNREKNLSQFLFYNYRYFCRFRKNILRKYHRKAGHGVRFARLTSVIIAGMFSCPLTYITKHVILKLAK